jgi:hypothetical protein
VPPLQLQMLRMWGRKRGRPRSAAPTIANATYVGTKEGAATECRPYNCSLMAFCPTLVVAVPLSCDRPDAL